MSALLKDRVVQAGVAGLIVAALSSFLEIYTVMGLPAHALLVHAPIVLIPMSALAAIAIVARSKWREQYGTIVLALVIITTISTVLSVGAGEALREHGVGGRGIEDHADAGSNLRIMVFGFAVFFVAFLGLGRHSQRQDKKGVALLVTQVTTALLAVVSVAGTAYTGHLGSKAVWEDKGFGDNASSQSSENKRMDNSGSGNARTRDENDD